MEIFIKISQLILSLSILVVIHELGHFSFAKLFKTRVEKFYLFFNPWFSLFKIKKGDTEYGIGWLPLGGYVKIAGMIDESMDKEQMKQPAKPDEFRSKTSGQRLLIMVGGVLFNLILAAAIYTGVLFTWGKEYLPVENMTYGVVCDSVALKTGLLDGDKIVSVGNQPLESSNDIIKRLIFDKAPTIEVNRNGEIISLSVPSQTYSDIADGAPFITARSPFIVSKFTKKSAAKKAGIQEGDRIMGIDTLNTEYFHEFVLAIQNYADTTVNIKLLRKEQEMIFPVNINKEAKIGAYAENVFEYESIKYTFLESIPAGINRAYSTGKDYLKQFSIMFDKDVQGYKKIGGFGAITSIFPPEWDWQSFWTLTGFLSIMLGILNILPIPALDGGHVLFLLYEIVTRRKPSDKFLEYAQMVGFILLLTLLVYANGNDIYRHWFEK